MTQRRRWLLATALCLATGAAGPARAATPVTLLPAVPQPSRTGDVVGALLQNVTGGTQPAGTITFGQVFADGAVPAGHALSARIGQKSAAIQLDAKNTYADGSVRMAVLSLAATPLAPGTAGSLMLSASSDAGAGAVPLAGISGWSFTVTIVTTGHNGTTAVLDLPSLLASALASGRVSYWLQGPLLTQGRIDVPITGSLHCTFDITRYASGAIHTDMQFNNDDAMQPVGGTLTYSVNVVQNGATVLNRSKLTQYQYQTWHQLFATDTAPALNIVHDAAYLASTGAVLNYDLSTGIGNSVIASEVSSMSGPGFGILGNDGITEYMPETGGRGDIGPLTQANTVWLMTGDAGAAAYAIAQADGAGSVPWHFHDPVRNHIITTDDYPGLWTDTRGNPGLTQQVSTSSGWTVDFPHAPELAYVPYLLTGSRYYLDQLNAEAGAAIVSYWPTPRAQPVHGAIVDHIVIGPGQQQRGSAWSLREQVDAAFANPDGSFEQGYFRGVMNDNFSWLMSQLSTWRAAEGQVFGWIPSEFATTLSPWQQDYFMSSVALAAGQGVTKAQHYVQWALNFNAQRFLAPAMDPYDGANYTWYFYNAQDPDTGLSSMSWAGLEAHQQSIGNSNGRGWSLTQGDYAQTALQSLADSISVLNDPSAMRAFAWLVGYGPQGYIGGTGNPATPQFNVAPRLADGTTLKGSQIFVVNDSTPHTVSAYAGDVMIVDIGTGADVLNASPANASILYGGAGNDALNGGSGNDFLFAGSGTCTLSAGPGANWLGAGTGVGTFVLKSTDTATDSIGGFKTGTDHLYPLDPNGNPFSANRVAQVIAGTTADAAGNAVLPISPTHSVTLVGIAPRLVSTVMFTSQQPVAVGSKTIVSTSGLTGWNTSNGTNNVNTLGKLSNSTSQLATR